MTLRGLCSESLFDKTYTFMLNEKGNALYLGYHTSIIYYEKAEESWVWFDRKDNRSKAVSASCKMIGRPNLKVSKAPETSLLLGVHQFDFSTVLEDKCTLDQSVVCKI